MSSKLATTLATYVFLLDRAGVAPNAGPVADAMGRLRAATEGFDALGDALAKAVAAGLGGESAGDVAGALRTIYGDRVRDGFGAAADREGRLGAIRRAAFGSPLPWLARIAERTADGGVGLSWVLVERLDEEVRVMDPNPWDGKDEERALPTEDFLVLWELGGNASARVA
jgi:hypothetical protein